VLATSISSHLSGLSAECKVHQLFKVSALFQVVPS